MPYVRQKTWLPLAPRIRGLSVKESPYGFPTKGMGDGCPSTEQLFGITDCSDPCQAGYGSCAAAAPGIPALPVGPVVTGSNVTNYAGTSIPLLSATNSLSAWLQANQTTVLLIGGGLFGLALLKGLK
jgi:hypothetical protein